MIAVGDLFITPEQKEKLSSIIRVNPKDPSPLPEYKIQNTKNTKQGDNMKHKEYWELSGKYWELHTKYWELSDKWWSNPNEKRQQRIKQKC